MVIKNFGQRLKFERKLARMGQKVLKDELRCSLQTISNWEAGRYVPSEARVDKIADVLKLSQVKRGKLQLLRVAALWKQRLRRIEPTLLKQVRQKELVERELLNELSIPLLTAKNAHDPAAVLLSRKPWRGQMVYKTPDIRGLCFGFLVSDGAMAPRYEPGDLLICSLRKPAADGLGVLRLRSRTLCRRFRQRGRDILLQALHEKVRPINVPRQQIRWAYRVERAIRSETTEQG